MQRRNQHHGTPHPLGIRWDEARQGYNFSIWSKTATSVRLLLFRQAAPYEVVYEYEFDPFLDKSGAIWHCFISVARVGPADCYAYRIDGPDIPGYFFNDNKLLLDPWAKVVFFPPDYSRAALMDGCDNIGHAPLAVLHQEAETAPGARLQRSYNHDLIIYELHVKGFTQHGSSGVAARHKGTFAGIIDKIPYLSELGITAVELMPVHQFDPQESNYWGYMTMNFFAPHSMYCTDSTGWSPVEEFKALVQALHDAEIEVILDVIYNHTAEADAGGPLYSYRGIDNASYYLMTPDLKAYNNDSGTGNVMRSSYKTVRQLILDSLRYWVQEMGVDGFRFDLATLFTRNDDGSINHVNPPLLEEISMDPVLSGVRLIAEPWDVSSFQLGTRFPGASWGQWNGHYRDDVRRFVKGDSGLVGMLMTRLYGSDDLFPDKLPESCHPIQSINFITSHDGFSLYDLVAYDQKHNLANGHHNTDGTDANYSWNCGWEGDQQAPAGVMELRKRQAKNFIAILMLSNGTPMIRMGDEFLSTQSGNNNAYNQDNETSWLDWRRKDEFADAYRFFRKIIAFRKAHPSIHRADFWKDDVRWYGVGKNVDMSYDSHALAFFLRGARLHDSDLYVMINAYWEPLNFQIMEGPGWRRVVDTALGDSNDIVDASDAPDLEGPGYQVQARSVVVLERPGRKAINQ
jgi:glycogen operon protein